MPKKRSYSELEKLSLSSWLFLFLKIDFLLFNLDCQNLAMLCFDNFSVSENENSLSEKNFHLQVFPLLRNLFPGFRNNNSVLYIAD